LESDKRIDEIIPLIIANMKIAPLSTEYNLGVDTFEDVFDTVKAKTKALAEITKVVLSEFGYCYVKRDQTTGEVLTVEGREKRQNMHDVSDVAAPAGLSTVMAYENLDDMCYEDDELMVFNETMEARLNYPVYGSNENAETMAFEDGTDMTYENEELMHMMTDFLALENPIFDLAVAHGDKLANRISYTVYPRYIDTSYSVLWTLNSVIEIGSGVTRANLLGDIVIRPVEQAKSVERICKHRLQQLIIFQYCRRRIWN
jgi:hypothetical protein